MSLGVAVLGATGVVGQRFVQLLENHPSFAVRSLVGQASAGTQYARAAQWLLDTPIPETTRDARIETLEELHQRGDIDLVFSALPSGKAGPVEAALAARGLHVFTNARDHRLDPDVPLLIPEVNPDHLALANGQRTPGRIVANGNCTAIILTLALAPLHRNWGLDEVHVTSLQGLSGAGHPGVSALDIVDNVVPYIEGEEDKVESEPQKTLGTLQDGRIRPARIPIHATCTRVPVREGHLETIHARLSRPARLEEIRRAFEAFTGSPDVRSLPTAPKQPIRLVEEVDGPQPRRDKDREGGMGVSVGRIRLSADGRNIRFVALGSNAVRGAAGQSILNAEFAESQGALWESR